MSLSLELNYFFTLKHNFRAPKRTPISTRILRLQSSGRQGPASHRGLWFIIPITRRQVANGALSSGCSCGWVLMDMDAREKGPTSGTPRKVLHPVQTRT
jgi:hypothetical protein